MREGRGMERGRAEDRGRAKERRRGETAEGKGGGERREIEREPEP